jgi:hypothetical protein
MSALEEEKIFYIFTTGIADTNEPNSYLDQWLRFYRRKLINQIKKTGRFDKIQIIHYDCLYLCNPKTSQEIKDEFSLLLTMERIVDGIKVDEYILFEKFPDLDYLNPLNHIILDFAHIYQHTLTRDGFFISKTDDGNINKNPLSERLRVTGKNIVYFGYIGSSDKRAVVDAVRDQIVNVPDEKFISFKRDNSVSTIMDTLLIDRYQVTDPIEYPFNDYCLLKAADFCFTSYEKINKQTYDYEFIQRFTIRVMKNYLGSRENLDINSLITNLLTSPISIKSGSAMAKSGSAMAVGKKRPREDDALDNFFMYFL